MPPYRSLVAVSVVGALIALAACGFDDPAEKPPAFVPDGSTVDTPQPDGGIDAAPDTSMSDALDAPPDIGADVVPDTRDGGFDSGDTDSGFQPIDGLGDLAGECGELDDGEWTSSSPFFFRNSIDFGTTGFDEAQLSVGGQKVLADGNLGGSSLHSEIIAYEVLYRCELAALLKTEAEILYQDTAGKKTDLLVSIDARKVGASVTRAFRFPPDTPYTVPEAENLLQGKLSDVLLSEANAAPADAWERSILHILAYDSQYADVVETAYGQIDPSVKAATIVVVTVTDGEDAFVY